ncbi:MAG TPA: glycoside hydrolase family 3 N-terminal domain-containing protein, partial [Pyrinomonadaceae bacterium]|nr:glycoside hydrolase family 3 N-terminal domain-containing protein [Pyrinomonadaceae bacterium]
ATVDGLLRNKLGFDGLTITDDLEMGAIVKNFGMGAACVMAVNAGIDMLSICASPDAIREGFTAVSAAVESGEIAESRIEESLRRIERYRAYLMPPVEFDEAELERVSAEIEVFTKELA